MTRRTHRTSLLAAAAMLSGLSAALVAPLATHAAAAGSTTVTLSTPADVRAGSGTYSSFTADVANRTGAAEPAERLDITLSGLAGLTASQVVLQYSTGSGNYTTVPLTAQSDGTLTGDAGPAAGATLADNADRVTTLRIRVGTSAPIGTLTITGTAVDGAAGAGDAVYGSGSVPAKVYRLPGAPAITSVSPKDAGLTVYLSTPTDSGGAVAITGYSVTAVAQGSGKSTTATSSSSIVSLTGLVDGTTYTLTGQARNEGGYGATSSAVAAIPQQQPLALTLSGGPTFVPIGTHVTYSGRLTRGALGVAGTTVVLIETYVDGRTAGLGAMATRADGSFSFSNAPLYNGAVSVSALGVTATVQSRVIVAFTELHTAVYGTQVAVTGSSTPGFIASPSRQERVELLEVDSHGHQLRVLELVNASQRHGQAGQAHGVNDVSFHVHLPAGTHRLVIRVLGTPVNTGAASRVLTVHV